MGFLNQSQKKRIIYRKTLQEGTKGFNFQFKRQSEIRSKIIEIVIKKI